MRLGAFPALHPLRWRRWSRLKAKLFGGSISVEERRVENRVRYASLRSRLKLDSYRLLCLYNAFAM